ncbi:hypothetical protein QE363_001914 [Sphingomonas sp. SORGH_AS870]|uniref:hypothetical protein n=1 Tax=Sphingomonas sp. SORGH_AS_0870 TaxID=3041801 RepID=UPI0028648248|nr:hypothetical protein [Sphingomonas sp. SORGH_AS_0870]MDR6146121.1 hypothetical protein [Sphingomonas sp. SORGH_AS_0870]
MTVPDMIVRLVGLLDKSERPAVLFSFMLLVLVTALTAIVLVVYELGSSSVAIGSVAMVYRWVRSGFKRLPRSAADE